MKRSMQEGSVPAGDEATEADGDDGRLGAAGQHDVGLTLADVVGGRDKCVVGCCAGGGDRVVGAHKARINTHQRASPAVHDRAAFNQCIAISCGDYCSANGSSFALLLPPGPPHSQSRAL